MRRDKKREIEPGSYTHDASVIAHLGKIYIPALAIIAGSVEAIYMVSDVVNDDGAGDEMIAVAQYGIAAAVGYVVLNKMQQHYEQRTKEIRS